MIYWAQIKHSRRTYAPGFIFPKGHEPRQHPLDVQRKIRLPEEQFSAMPSVYPWATGEFVDPQLFPEWIKFETTEKVVQDFYKPRGWFVVSARVKAKIIELEPDVHQFVPVRLLQNDGSEPWGEYYFFNIRQHVFSIDEAKSPFYKWVGQSNPSNGLKLMNLTRTPPTPPDKSYSFKAVHLVYRAAAVDNKIIWREKLDLDTFPNTGTRCFSRNPDGSVTVKDLDPENPTLAAYFLEDEYGFRVAESLTTWMDLHDVKGLDCSRFPGILDSDWPEEAR